MKVILKAQGMDLYSSRNELSVVMQGRSNVSWRSRGMAGSVDAMFKIPLLRDFAQQGLQALTGSGQSEMGASGDGVVRRRGTPGKFW